MVESRPKVFVGSSRERLGVAEAIHRALELDAEVTPWHLGAFGPSEYPLESLGVQLDSADFAIFVFAPDDIVTMRGADRPSVRDNVIFELGLFIGRLSRQCTFILRPRGQDLHLPSDLDGFGAVDYDATRTDENLDAAVGPAAAKIRAAIKRQFKPRLSKEPAQAQPAALLAQEPSAQDMTDLDPRADWDLDTFRFRYLHAVVIKNDSGCSAIHTAFSESPFAQNDQSLVEWEAWRLYAEIAFGDSLSQVGKLRAIFEKHSENPLIASWWARVQVDLGDSAGAFETAANALTGTRSVGTASNLIELFNQTRDENSHVDISLWRDKVISLRVDHPAEFANFGSAMKTLARMASFEKILNAIDEAIIARTPEDTSLRFSIAYSYSTLEGFHHDLSLFHYNAIPFGSRNSVTWNNIGVSYDNLRMPGLSVDAYERALPESDGLADSNLALKLIGQGFVEQGRQRLKDAISAGKEHSSLAKALSRIA